MDEPVEGQLVGGSAPKGLPVLERAAPTRQPTGSLVMVVLDGVGVGRGDEFHAVATAHTPTIDRLCSEGLARTLRAHGPAAGLASEGDMGNSEVGHNTLGAGRIFDQGANLVDAAIRAGLGWRVAAPGGAGRGPSFHPAPGRPAVRRNVHSSFSQLVAVLDRAARDGVALLRVHVLLDGRDVLDFTALDYVGMLEHELERLLGTGGAMPDRERWRPDDDDDGPLWR